MALGGLGGALGGVTGAAGGLVGSILSPLGSALGLGQTQQGSYTSMQVAPETDEEKKLKQLLMNASTASTGMSQYDFLSPYIKGTQNLASAYQNLSLLPTEADVAAGQKYANQLFASQQASLESSARTQSQEAARQAASLGRSVADPVLQAKLRSSLMEQQAQLEGQKTGTAAKYATEFLPQQRLAGLEAQQTGVGMLGNLFSTQQTLNQQQQSSQQNLFQALQNFRLASAGKMTTGTTNEGPLASLFALAGSGAKTYSTMKGD